MTQSLREQLIGAWTLVSYEERPVDGSPSFYPMSEQPVGIIMYTPDGYMSAQLMKPGRTTRSFTGRLRRIWMLREVVDRKCVGGIWRASARAHGVNFQACSFNHSDISPS